MHGADHIRSASRVRVVLGVHTVLPPLIEVGFHTRPFLLVMNALVSVSG